MIASEELARTRNHIFRQSDVSPVNDEISEIELFLVQVVGAGAPLCTSQSVCLSVLCILMSSINRYEDMCMNVLYDVWIATLPF